MISELSKEDTDTDKVKDIMFDLLDTVRLAAGDPTVMPMRHIEQVQQLAEPSLETVEKAKRSLTKQSPIERLLGWEPEELSKAEKIAMKRLRAKDKRDKAREERRQRLQPKP